MGKLDGLAQPMGELDGQHQKKVGFRELFTVSRVARGIPSVMYRQYFGTRTIFPSRTRHMAGVEGCSVVVQHKKKSDFGSYSLYLALHEGFLRNCTGSISVRYFQVARGLWQGLRAAALL